MRVTLDYAQEVTVPLEQAFFQKVAEETVARCRLPELLEKKHIQLTAVAVSSEKIQELNRTYRQKDAVTDILSFGEYTDSEALKKESGEEVFLGELFFCESFIEKAAAEDEVTLEHEMAYIFSHGILHLMGYDHSETMFAIQDEVTDLFAKK